jgi:hypothetical protein
MHLLSSFIRVNISASPGNARRLVRYGVLKDGHLFDYLPERQPGLQSFETYALYMSCAAYMSRLA